MDLSLRKLDRSHDPQYADIIDRLSVKQHTYDRSKSMNMVALAYVSPHTDPDDRHLLETELSNIQPKHIVNKPIYYNHNPALSLGCVVDYLVRGNELYISAMLNKNGPESESIIEGINSGSLSEMSISLLPAQNKVSSKTGQRDDKSFVDFSVVPKDGGFVSTKNGFPKTTQIIYAYSQEAQDNMSSSSTEDALNQLSSILEEDGTSTQQQETPSSEKKENTESAPATSSPSSSDNAIPDELKGRLEDIIKSVKPGVPVEEAMKGMSPEHQKMFIALARASSNGNEDLKRSKEQSEQAYQKSQKEFLDKQMEFLKEKNMFDFQKDKDDLMFYLNSMAHPGNASTSKVVKGIFNKTFELDKQVKEKEEKIKKMEEKVKQTEDKLKRFKTGFENYKQNLVVPPAKRQMASHGQPIYSYSGDSCPAATYSQFFQQTSNNAIPAAASPAPTTQNPSHFKHMENPIVNFLTTSVGSASVNDPSKVPCEKLFEKSYFQMN